MEILYKNSTEKVLYYNLNKFYKTLLFFKLEYNE